MLSDLIGLHFYKDNVSVTIVDRDGKVIFNTVPTMTRSPVNLTPQLKTYMSNNLNGSFVGRDYLVGYAGLKKSDWNIIVSTPSEVVTSMLLNTVKKISGLVLAILFFITTGVAFFLYVSQNHWSSLRGWFRPMTVSCRQRNSLPSGPGIRKLIYSEMRWKNVFV
jgi:hypothetical protein